MIRLEMTINAKEKKNLDVSILTFVFVLSSSLAPLNRTWLQAARTSHQRNCLTLKGLRFRFQAAWRRVQAVHAPVKARQACLL